MAFLCPRLLVCFAPLSLTPSFPFPLTLSGLFTLTLTPDRRHGPAAGQGPHPHRAQALSRQPVREAGFGPCHQGPEAAPPGGRTYHTCRGQRPELCGEHRIVEGKQGWIPFFQVGEDAARNRKSPGAPEGRLQGGRRFQGEAAVRIQVLHRRVPLHLRGRRKEGHVHGEGEAAGDV